MTEEGRINPDFVKAVEIIKGNRSLREMAADTGISASYICGILQGRYYPTLKIFKRMTKASSHPQGNVTVLDLIALVNE